MTIRNPTSSNDAINEINTINSKNVASKSRIPCILALAFAFLLALTWALSLRPVRLKIGDYYFSRGSIDQAVNWYGKVLRRFKLTMTKDGAYHLRFPEDSAKMKSSFLLKMRNSLLGVGQILGFGQHEDLQYFIKDPTIFLKDINVLGHQQKDNRQKTKQNLADFNNALQYFENLQGETSVNTELDSFISLYYFFRGFIDEAENDLISAFSNYEMASKRSHNTVQLNERRKRVAFEYFRRYPSIKKVHNANVVLQSEFPLIITGVTLGVDNYLAYEDLPVKIIMGRYSSTKLKIQGEVLGATKQSCIIPRVVFWGTKGYNGETASKYSVKGNFDISFLFTVPDGTLIVIPRITFDDTCFLQGQKLFVKDFKWY